MCGHLRNRLRRLGELIPAALERAILSSGMLSGTLLTLLILCLGVRNMAR